MIERSDGEIAAIAQRLCGQEVRALTRFHGGRNSRVYRVETVRERFALKFFSSEHGARDRLGTEYAALEFLCGIGAGVPRPIARDASEGAGLYEWIEGEHFERPGAADVAAVLEFLGTIHRRRTAGGSEIFGFAAEAALSREAVVDNISRRFQRLSVLAATEPALGAYLEDFGLAFAVHTGIGGALEGMPAAADLPRAAQTLSPSDFSVHNALRRPDGRLAFFDFEYFGWDDPVKLVSDFIWHPAMELELGERRQFLAGAAEVYGDDPSFAGRLRARFALFGLKWCMIVLNEFIPERWQARVFSGNEDAWETVKTEQLAKAQSLLERVRGPHGSLE